MFKEGVHNADQKAVPVLDGAFLFMYMDSRPEKRLREAARVRA